MKSVLIRGQPPRPRPAHSGTPAKDLGEAGGAVGGEAEGAGGGGAPDLGRREERDQKDL